MPELIPETMPLAEFAVAIPVLLLDHVPPGAPSVKVTGEPIQMWGEPEILPGTPFTVTDWNE